MNIGKTEIYGADADAFMALSCDDKKVWIKENTPHKSDDEIQGIIDSLIRGNDEECHGCKEAKNEQPKTNTPEVTAAIEPVDVAGNGSGASNKRRDKPAGN